MMSIASWPPLSTGIEWLFSSMVLIHTEFRNRFGSDKITKLVHVCRHLSGRKMTTLGKTSEGVKKLNKNHLLGETL